MLVRGEERCAARMLGGPVGEPGAAALRVAMDQGMDPFVPQADEGRRGCGGGGVPLAEQPQGLGAAWGCRRRCALVALPEWLNRQMRSKR